MTAERVERLKARLNEVIATAEACDELSWPYTLPHPAPRRDAYAKAMPPSLAVSLARADLALIEEHIDGDGEEWDEGGCRACSHCNCVEEWLGVPFPCPFLLSRCSAWGIE